MLEKNGVGWIVENNICVRKVDIVCVSGNLITIKFNSTVIRLPKHRVYESEEKALESIKKVSLKKQISNPYDYWH